MSSRHDVLNELIARLREEGTYVLAAPEDADFFRKKRSAVSPPLEALPSQPSVAKAVPLSPPTETEPSVAPVLKTPPPPVPSPPIAPQLIKAEPPPLPQSAPPEKLVKPPLNFASLRQTIAAIAPELLIIDEIPSDLFAQKMAERWKTKNQTAPLSVLSYQEPPEQKALLEQLTKALDISFGPAKLIAAEGIEKENQWANFLSVAELKMVIVCDYTLWQLAHLMTFYKETPAQGKRLLGNVPLFLLPDLSLYLKDPLLKRSLWKALCQKFS